MLRYQLKNKEKKNWLSPTSEFKALQDIVFSNSILKDLTYLTKFSHTGTLEVYHFLYNRWIRKSIHFSFHGRLLETAWEFLQTRKQNFEINLLKSIRMQIWKSFSIYSNSYKHNTLKILHFLSQEFLSYLPVKFVYFVKSRLFFNISKIFKIQNAKFFEYCFCMNTNI